MDCLKQNMLIHGDNIKALAMLSKEVTGVKLAYLDPPYCSNTNNEHYSDCYSVGEYESYLQNLVRLVFFLLDKSGIIAIQIDSLHSFNIKNMMDKTIGRRNFKGQVVVGKNDHKRYENERGRLISGYDCLLLYAKDPRKKLPNLIEEKKEEQDGEWTSFYTTSQNKSNRYCLYGVNVENGSWRRSRKWAEEAMHNYRNLEQFIQDNNLSNNSLEYNIRFFRDYHGLENHDLHFLRYNDHRVEYYLPPSYEKHITDNWSDINIRGCSTNFEHEVSACYLSRLFRWLTVKNDIILDPFLGSGTSIIVASNLKRRWIGIEKEPYCKTAILERVKQVEREVHVYEIP